MKTFELIFETDPIDEHLQDLIDEHFDALMSRQGGSFFITLSAEGPDARDAALLAAGTLQSLGVRVRRLTEDLVSRSDIAERTGKTPQAVGAWVRGERQAAAPFPQPFNYVAGGVWLWGEVNEWLARVHGPADDVDYPSREDYVHVNFMLNEVLGTTMGVTSVARVSWMPSVSHAPAPLPVDVHFTRTLAAVSGDELTNSAPRHAAADESWDSFTLAG